MTCFIPLKCWTDDDNVVQMFVAFFFNQVEQGEISTFCGASEYDFVWFFDIVCHSFFIWCQNEKSTDTGQAPKYTRPFLLGMTQGCQVPTLKILYLFIALSDLGEQSIFCIFISQNRTNIVTVEVRLISCLSIGLIQKYKRLFPRFWWVLKWHPPLIGASFRHHWGVPVSPAWIYKSQNLANIFTTKSHLPVAIKSSIDSFFVKLPGLVCLDHSWFWNVKRLFFRCRWTLKWVPTQIGVAVQILSIFWHFKWVL